MTIRVKYNNGVFEPITPIDKYGLNDGSEFEIEIPPQKKIKKLRGIVGLFSDLSQDEVRKFEKAAKRQPLFSK